MGVERSTLFVAVPVYNHAATLRTVVEGVLQQHDRVLVVDDGSSDNASEAIADLPVELICRPRNLGKGAALRTA
ncbi:MAG: DUF2062 domain-containing protein, partial [Desulfuromonas sp.]